MSDKRFSIITKDFEQCLVCGSYLGIHKHEIFFGRKNRELSIKYGLVVPLCHRHHNGSNFGVHNKNGHVLDMKLKKLGQEAFEHHYPDLNFLKIFGRNYL